VPTVTATAIFPGNQRFFKQINQPISKGSIMYLITGSTGNVGRDS